MSGNYSTPRWRKLRATFRLDCERRQLPCGICRQPIDYRLKHPDPNAWHPDHVKPALHRSPTSSKTLGRHTFPPRRTTAWRPTTSWYTRAWPTRFAGSRKRSPMHATSWRP